MSNIGILVVYVILEHAVIEANDIPCFSAVITNRLLININILCNNYIFIPPSTVENLRTATAFI